MEDLRAMTGRINEIATGYVGAQVLFTANAADVFALLETPRTAAEVAAQRGWPERSARMLLDGLVALELVARDGAAYVNTPLAAACLAPGGPAYQGHILRHHQNGWDTWGRLGEAVATGQPVAVQGERSPEELRHFILGMRDVARFSAREVLGALDLSGYRHVLDLGGGPATYAITFLEAVPAMRATLFDRPEVVPIAQEQAAAAGLSDRFAFRAGDMTTDDIGSGYDLIMLSNVAHCLGPAVNAALVKKCYGALEPGGRLILKDFLADDDRTGPPFSLLFALRMLLHCDGGDTYTFAEAKEWTRAAGFTDGEAVALTPQTRLWAADKP